MLSWRSDSSRNSATSLRPEPGDRIRIALQKALIGQITPTLRLVSVEPDAAQIRVVVFFDSNLPEDDRREFAEEVASCLGLEFGDPPAGPVVDCHFLRCDEPQYVPVRGKVVFARKGVRTF